MTNNRLSIVSAGTKIGQDEQNQQQEQQKQQYQYNNRDNYYYNNIITTRTQACSDLPCNEIMEQIAEAYRQNISREITQAAALVIENALTHGMEPATVILAIEETGLASRPSPYYLRAVLRNWAERGVATCRAREKWTQTNGRPWWR